MNDKVVRYVSLDPGTSFLQPLFLVTISGGQLYYALLRQL